MGTPVDVIIGWGFTSIVSKWLGGLTRPYKYIEIPTPTGQHYGATVPGKHPVMDLLASRGIDSPRRVMACGFSESCQGVMSLLRSDDAALIEHAIMIDGIHCGWSGSGTPNAARDNIHPSCLGPVIGYADWASRGSIAVDGLPPAKRYCTITHSSIIPPFPSTTDTARTLLNKLFGSGWPNANVPEALKAIEGFKAGYGQHGLSVLGYEGTVAADHIRQGGPVFKAVIENMFVPRWNSIDPNVPGCTQTVYGNASGTFSSSGEGGAACSQDAPLVVPSEPIEGSVHWQKYYDGSVQPQGQVARNTALWVAGGILAVTAGIFAGTLLINGGKKLVRKHNPRSSRY